jgi:metallophosphoesterase superfamily enzyme
MIKIINDLHAGVRRQGGTTISSRAALNKYISKEIKGLLTWATDTDVLVILGDIFDKAKVSEVVLVDVLFMLTSFLRESKADLILVRGNHDSKSELVDDMCSLEALYTLLVAALSDMRDDPTRVHLVFNEPLTFEDEGIDYHIIPHMFNQEAFDQAIENVPECTYLLLHCNFDCRYAVGDHSLNLTREQAKKLERRVNQILIAHEHQSRVEMRGSVVVLGNQFPTSIADCLNNTRKKAWVTNAIGMDDYPTWTSSGSFRECNPTDIQEAEFVRVSGTCKQPEFGQIVRDIAAYRKISDAFVISNAVKVEAVERSISKEDVSKINILELLIKTIPEQFQGRVRECLL